LIKNQGKIRNMNRVYFDNAATTPVSPEVIEVMTAALREQYGNPSSIHAEGRSVRALIEESRKIVAHSIGASTSEVFFTSGGTEANNMAIKCSVRDLGVERIISTKLEHHCGLHSIESVGNQGVELVWLETDCQGYIDLADLKHQLAASPKKTLVTLMHANNEIGTMIDMQEVSAICAQFGAYFHSDTVQTIGHFPIDVNTTPISFLSGAAHKFHGPKGIGFLYINHANQIKPFIDGGSQERNMRGGTENVIGIVGLAHALKQASQEMESRQAHIMHVRNYLKDRLLQEFDDIRFNGDPEGAALYTVLSVSFPPSPKSEMLLLLLDIGGLSVSGGSACTSGSEKGSHVLEGVGADPARKSIRFSFSHYNTIEEVDFAITKLIEILAPAAKTMNMH
jgi:cysteine desulfurase